MCGVSCTDGLPAVIDIRQAVEFIEIVGILDMPLNHELEVKSIPQGVNWK
jgi:hypothetical protein